MFLTRKKVINIMAKSTLSLAGQGAFLFLKSDANPRRRRNAFQSISYHSLSLARKLKV